MGIILFPKNLHFTILTQSRWKRKKIYFSKLISPLSKRIFFFDNKFQVNISNIFIIVTIRLKGAFLGNKNLQIWNQAVWAKTFCLGNNICMRSTTIKNILCFKSIILLFFTFSEYSIRFITLISLFTLTYFLVQYCHQKEFSNLLNWIKISDVKVKAKFTLFQRKMCKNTQKLVPWICGASAHFEKNYVCNE